MKFDKGIEESKAKIFFSQMVNAIAYCHCRHVVHRDLKPENMVICSESDSVKLTDFGFSNIFEDGKTLQTSCGSLAYSAPEILLGEEYDASAVGMIDFKMLDLRVNVRIFRCLVARCYPLYACMWRGAV